MTKRERSNPEWQALIAEHQILKRKLQSKSEALLIISRDLYKVQIERNQFKIMAEKLQERCQAYKKQQSDYILTGDKAKLILMMQEIKSQKVNCQQQNEVLQQKLNEALGDVKLLREKFARQTIGDEGIGARHFPLHEREKLVLQLEESQQMCLYWRREYESQVEIANEALLDRDGSQEKANRLNLELSRALSGDNNRIVDIDALCMENKYLQERVSQCLKEKNNLYAEINKYKNMTSSKKTLKGDFLRSGSLRAGELVVSPKHLKDLLSKGVNHNSGEKIANLQSIVSTLLETVNDKNLALHHLRNTNKILGNRVSDLERKLKTLEVGGFWNIEGQNRTLLQSENMLSPDIDKRVLKRRSINSESTSSESDDDNISIDNNGSLDSAPTMNNLSSTNETIQSAGDVSFKNANHNISKEQLDTNEAPLKDLGGGDSFALAIYSNEDSGTAKMLSSPTNNIMLDLENASIKDSGSVDLFINKIHFTPDEVGNSSKLNS